MFIHKYILRVESAGFNEPGTDTLHPPLVIRRSAVRMQVIPMSYSSALFATLKAALLKVYVDGSSND